MLPLNIASYAMLTHILAKLTGCKPRKLIYFGSNVHLYKAHFDAASEYIENSISSRPCRLSMPDFKDLDDLLVNYVAEDFRLIGYYSAGIIKAPLLVGDNDD